MSVKRKRIQGSDGQVVSGSLPTVGFFGEEDGEAGKNRPSEHYREPGLVGMQIINPHSFQGFA
jgi:hypothetical protein